MYFYQSHLGGGIFYSEEEIDWDDLYCEQCGDSDTELGYYETAEEAKEDLIDYEDWSEEYIKEVEEIIDEAFS